MVMQPDRAKGSGCIYYGIHHQTVRRTLVVGLLTFDRASNLTSSVPRMCLLHTPLPVHCYCQRHNPLVRPVTTPLPRYAQTAISPA